MLLRLMPIAAAALLAAACGLVPTGADRSAVELDANAPSSIEFEEPQRGIRLQAEYEGNRLWFQIGNYEVDGLLIAPESFAVVGHMQQVHYSRDEDVVTRFAPRMLDRGASMAGEMVVLPVESLENWHLMYHSTQTNPQNWTCEIVPRRTPATETPDQAPTEDAAVPQAP